MKRREFTTKATLGMLAAPLIPGAYAKNIFQNTPNAAGKIPLGMDAHSVRGMKWKAEDLINHAASLKVNSLMFNSTNYFKNLEEGYLKSVSKQLKKNNIQLYFGVGSLSVNSTTFTKLSNAKQKIKDGIRLSKIFNTPAVTCKIGNLKDRYTDGGIVARMEEIIGELRAMRSQIQDAGMKFAVENHAGDLRSEEVLTIIEEVGSDVCGAMLDPGNSVWAMENPMQQIQKLGKHVLCSSVRDYKVWESENGATFQWTAVGEGSIDFDKYIKLFTELCPGVPLHIESISNSQREIPFMTKEHMEGYPDLKASDILDFLHMVKKGTPAKVAVPPTGSDAKAFWRENQKKELKKSLEYLRNNYENIQ